MAMNVHVVPRAGKWAVKGEGNQRASKITSTKRQALHTARRIARNKGADVVIHGRDGRIPDKDSYGGDPFPPRDTAP